MQINTRKASLFTVSQAFGAIWVIIEAKMLIEAFGLNWYGVFIFILGALAFITAFFSFDIGKTAQLYLARKNAKGDTDLTVLLWLDILAPVVGVTILNILVIYGHNVLPHIFAEIYTHLEVLHVLSVIFILRASSNVWFAFKRKHSHINTIALATFVITLAKIIFWLINGTDVEIQLYLYFYLIVEVVRFIFEIYQLRSVIRLVPEVFIFLEECKAEKDFLKTTYIVSSVGLLSKKLDTTLIGIFLSPYNLAVYRIVKMLCQSSNVITAPLINLYFMDFLADDSNLNFSYFYLNIRKYLIKIGFVILIVLPTVGYFAGFLLPFWDIDVPSNLSMPLFIGLLFSEIIRVLFFWVYPTAIAKGLNQSYIKSALISLIGGLLLFGSCTYLFGIKGAALSYFSWYIGAFYLFFRLKKIDEDIV